MRRELWSVVWGVWLAAGVLGGCGGDDDADPADARAALDGGVGDGAVDVSAVDVGEVDAGGIDVGGVDAGVDAELERPDRAVSGDDGVSDAGLDMAGDMTLDAGALDEGVTEPDAEPDAAPPGCAEGVTVSASSDLLPPSIAGVYAEAFDCVREEGGGWFDDVDYTHCFRREDGSGWLIWNTGCGWEVGREEEGDWVRYARTYSGRCDLAPPQQRDARALTTGVLYDGFGTIIEDVRLDHCPTARPCEAGVTVSGEAARAPAELNGHYVEADDCAREEGGAWFGGVDPRRCFRKDDGSAWRIWNTGCGWEIGRVEEGDWQRSARTYSGQCAEMPAVQRGPEALTTGVMRDSTGLLLVGLRADYCPVECARGVGVSVAGRDLPAEMGGRYAEAFDCARAEGGGWFGGDYTHCFRGEGDWRLWNTGCGWEVGRLEGERGMRPEWRRYARTYSGQCAAMPGWQLDERGLTSRPLFDGFGNAVEGLDIDACLTPLECPPEAVVTVEGDAVPAGMAGVYAEAFDCTRAEGGAWFGVSDFTRCFRGDDGWVIWNTGCGWEVGRVEDGSWARYARTYSGECAAMPPAQLETRALTTGLLFDGFGGIIDGVRVDHCR